MHFHLTLNEVHVTSRQSQSFLRMIITSHVITHRSHTLKYALLSPWYNLIYYDIIFITVSIVQTI